MSRNGDPVNHQKDINAYSNHFFVVKWLDNTLEKYHMLVQIQPKEKAFRNKGTYSKYVKVLFENTFIVPC